MSTEFRTAYMDAAMSRLIFIVGLLFWLAVLILLFNVAGCSVANPC